MLGRAADIDAQNAQLEAQLAASGAGQAGFASGFGDFLSGGAGGFIGGGAGGFSFGGTSPTISSGGVPIPGVKPTFISGFNPF